jgi:predicted aminopeptidase
MRMIDLIVVTGRSLGRIIGRLLAGILVVAVGFLALTQTGRYLARAAWEEGKILKHRRPITEIVNDSATPPAVRQKLRLVLAARAFSADSVHLEARQSFTTFSQLSSDTLVLVLSGAYRDQLQPKTW